MTELSRRTLTAARLDALPAALRRRPELRALRYAVSIADGEAEPAGRASYLAALAANLRRLARLDALLAAAEAEGLRLAPIKGALLCRTHYGDPGARPMVDVDLLCAPDDVARVVAIGRALGLERYDPEPFRRARQATHDVKLIGGGVAIELHHRLWHELRIAGDVAPLIERARRVPFGATAAWALDDADHLYVVCVHAATHGFVANALWMTDAALLVAGAAEPPLRRLVTMAQATRARVALAAACDQLRLALPWLALDGVDGTTAPLRRAILRRLAPWLVRGERELGLWPGRLVRPLLFDRRRDLGSWAVEKLTLLRR